MTIQAPSRRCQRRAGFFGLGIWRTSRGLGASHSTACLCGCESSARRGSPPGSPRPSRWRAARQPPPLRSAGQHPLQDQLAVRRHAASTPPCHQEAISGVSALHTRRVDVGVMPATRPDRISDSVSLSDKLRREKRPLVTEEGAVDSGLVRSGNKAAPYKSGVSVLGSEDDLFARPSEQAAHPPISVLIRGVVPLIQCQDGSVAVFSDPPVSNSGHPRRSVTFLLSS
jgi:hypothetical protein